MTRCACGREIAIGPGIYLPRLKLRIFNIIRRAGHDGIAGTMLLREYGLPISPKTLKVHIHQINQALRPTGYRISDGRVGNYRLIAPSDQIKGEWIADPASERMADRAA
jgi:hypothetical protein